MVDTEVPPELGAVTSTLAEARRAQPHLTARFRCAEMKGELVSRYAATQLLPPPLSEVAHAVAVVAHDHLAIHRSVPQMVAMHLVVRDLRGQRRCQHRTRFGGGVESSGLLGEQISLHPLGLVLQGSREVKRR
eukprot:scaffold42965_cov75-Phaeocystis_antarctica.AAC.4